MFFEENIILSKYNWIQKSSKDLLANINKAVLIVNASTII